MVPNNQQNTLKIYAKRLSLVLLHFMTFGHKTKQVYPVGMETDDARLCRHTLMKYCYCHSAGGKKSVTST